MNKTSPAYLKDIMPNFRTKELWKNMSKYIRVKYTGDDGLCECMTCGCLRHPSKLQGGHVFPKGSIRYRALEFDERNVFPQCGYCNKYRMNYPEYKERAEAHARAVYGDDGIDNMLMIARVSKSKMSQTEINLKSKAYKQLYLKLCKEKKIKPWGK
jgi:hypothetical protein